MDSFSIPVIFSAQASKLCSFSSVHTCGTAPICPPSAPLCSLFPSPCSPSRPSEPPEDHHVVQLLGPQPPAEPALQGFPPLAVEGAMAHHLLHCHYHLRLLRNWLVSGQELLKSLHGYYSPPFVSSSSLWPHSASVGGSGTLPVQNELCISFSFFLLSSWPVILSFFSLFPPVRSSSLLCQSHLLGCLGSPSVLHFASHVRFKCHPALARLLACLPEDAPPCF